MNSKVINKLEKLFDKQENLKSEIIQISFNVMCEKITLDNNENIIAKYYKNPKNISKFDAILSEAKALNYMNRLGYNIFPKVHLIEDGIMLIDYIKHNNKKINIEKTNFLYSIAELHSNKSKNYGFDFDSQIGGMRQPNNINSNWVDFFSNQRLTIIYEEICKTNKMPLEINRKIEKLIKNINNLIPNNPGSSLLHGDLWEGNILFKEKKLVGLIDPGIFFGHNEMELSYLRFFNYINKSFLDQYNNLIQINKDYYKYEPVYQIYYSLLNVHLWSREYINQTALLLEKLKF